MSLFDNIKSYSEKASLTTLKKQELHSFLENGFPTTKNEEWKYTSLKNIIDDAFSIEEGRGVVSENDFEKHSLGFKNKIIFVNGVLISSPKISGMSISDFAEFESENKDVTEVQLTEEMKEQMEDNGEWRNTADGNGLIFGIVFPDASFAPVKNADGKFLTFNFDDTSLTLPGTNIELEFSKKIESDFYASFEGGTYASRNIVAINESMGIEKETIYNE